jgi:uncharacterized repeat protein (TIGR01451 family)
MQIPLTRTCTTRARPALAACAALACALAVALPASARSLASSDLVVTQTAGAAEVLVGQTVTFTVTVHNDGPDTATALAVHQALSGAKATVVSATPTQGDPCTLGTTNRRVRCLIGTLAPGNDAQVTIVVTAVGSGTLTATADATAKEGDPNQSNSQTTLDTKIHETEAPVDLLLKGSVFAETVTSKTIFPMSWRATDKGSGIKGYDVRYRAAPFSAGFGPYVVWRTATTENRGEFPAKPGTSYCFSARATDKDGNASQWTADQCTTVLLGSAGAKRAGGWTARNTSLYTRSTGASLGLPRVVASKLFLSVVRCPGCGSATVFWRGKPLRTVNLGAPLRAPALVLVRAFPAPQQGAVLVRVVSSGKTVTINGFGFVKR